MNIKQTSLGLTLLPLAASVLLSSCVSSGYQSGGGRYATYASLPPNYSGTSYYYNNRYYAGGRYETGRYSHGGRTYANRYYHNGQYLYGGDYRRQPVRTVSRPAPRPARGGYVTYRTLPPTYAGSAYYYNNQYYGGGRYETGRYTDQGRTYSGRYYHNGRYLYGGAYQQHAARNTATRKQGNQKNQKNRKKRPGNAHRSGY